MKFRSRFTGELKFTQTPADGQATAIGQSRQVKQTEIIELSDRVVELFGDSIRRHVAAGVLVPLDKDAKEKFPKK